MRHMRVVIHMCTLIGEEHTARKNSRLLDMVLVMSHRQLTVVQQDIALVMRHRLERSSITRRPECASVSHSSLPHTTVII
jgi:hypothetical protein